MAKYSLPKEMFMRRCLRHQTRQDPNTSDPREKLRRMRAETVQRNTGDDWPLGRIAKRLPGSVFCQPVQPAVSVSCKPVNHKFRSLTLKYISLGHIWILSMM
jgi:hypothetical protein